MNRIEDLGTPADLEATAAEFQRLIEAAGLAEPHFRDWTLQILVDHPEKRALVLKAGTVIPGDLLLDTDAEPFLSGDYSCVVALGDLTVQGQILNADSEDAPFLLVGGSLYADELIKAAAGIVVLGSLNIKGLTLCDGDNGALLVGGALISDAVIDCDHEILVLGDVQAAVASDDLGNMRELLVADVFEDPDDPSNEWPEGDLIRSRLVAGLPVLKSRS